MKDIRIPESELELMKVLWSGAPLTLPEVVKQVQVHNNWETVTVKTLLGRLVKKGLVVQQGSRRNYLYTPAVSREEHLAAAGSSFAKKLFGGAPTAMISFFMRSSELSQADIDELQKQIDELKK